MILIPPPFIHRYGTTTTTPAEEPSPCYYMNVETGLEWFERCDLVATVRRHQGQIPDKPPTFANGMQRHVPFLEDPLSFNNCRYELEMKDRP